MISYDVPLCLATGGWVLGSIRVLDGSSWPSIGRARMRAMLLTLVSATFYAVCAAQLSALAQDLGVAPISFVRDRRT